MHHAGAGEKSSEERSFELRTPFLTPNTTSHATRFVRRTTSLEQITKRSDPFPKAASLSNYKKIVAAGRRTLPCFFMYTRTPLPQPMRLHFFEQRYRRLIRLTLSTPHKTFVYCPHNTVTPGCQAYIVEVTDVNVYPDERADVELTARAMCAVEGCFSDNVGDSLAFTKVRELKKIS